MRIRITLLVFLCGMAFAVFYFRESTKPPRETTVIENFNKHRIQYEQLRVMLKQDNDLDVVAEWGIRRNNSLITEVPPNGGFSVERFQQYISTFKAAEVEGADQTRGTQPVVCLWVWATGFAGDTRHVEVCSVDIPPQNQVASLEVFYKSPKPRKPVYRHIEGEWYIWADW